jgi:hypothetical protein
MRLVFYWAFCLLSALEFPFLATCSGRVCLYKPLTHSIIASNYGLVRQLTINRIEIATIKQSLSMKRVWA